MKANKADYEENGDQDEKKEEKEESFSSSRCVSSFRYFSNEGVTRCDLGFLTLVARE